MMINLHGAVSCYPASMINLVRW